MGTFDSNAGALERSVASQGSQDPGLEAEVAGLFDTYRAPLLRFVRSVGISEGEGEEVIQEVFLALYRHLRAGKPRQNLRAWLFQTGYFLALKIRQRGPAPAGETPPEPETPEQLLLSAERQRRLDAVIRAMPETDRAVLALRMEGLRFREIADALAISVSGAANALERAMARIRRVDS